MSETTPKTEAASKTQSSKTAVATKAGDDKEDLQQAVFIAVIAALAGKGTPADEAAELAKQYAISGVATYF